MEFWIFIVIAAIGIILISIVAFVAKCFGYKKVMKKIRTLSMSSNQSAEDAECGNRRSPGRGQDRNVVLPAPPAYAISFQHPVIARAPAPATGNQGNNATPIGRSRSESGVPESLPVPEVGETDPAEAPPATDANSQMWSGSAFPGESVFVPPPYCMEPPAYSETSPEDGICSEGSITAPSYTA